MKKKEKPAKYKAEFKNFGKLDLLIMLKMSRLQQSNLLNEAEMHGVNIDSIISELERRGLGIKK